ncbi:hypothetical protein [Streptomyces sp. NK15101]|uniref:hypothetical protein n=1 Tax=Streptomyces sp. NK15101 TaxID=2873261 RepID=UPI001CED16E4|nr:hypothetical protein [Streptomyces sp. NK15101]
MTPPPRPLCQRVDEGGGDGPLPVEAEVDAVVEVQAGGGPPGVDRESRAPEEEFGDAVDVLAGPAIPASRQCG